MTTSGATAVDMARSRKVSIKLGLARVAHLFERAIDKTRRRPIVSQTAVDPYLGFPTPESIVLRGRVLTSVAALSADQHQSRWRNAADFIRLFMTDELADIPVHLAGSDVVTRTDEEGFFRLDVPRDTPTADGYIAVTVGRCRQRALMPFVSVRAAKFGVISDIDDTIMQTGAFSFVRNLWTSITGNVHARHVFPDAVALLNAFDDRGACFFYVSSSPWNLHGYLLSVFTRAQLPPGPFFLRDLGVSKTQFITSTHGAHKISAISAILSDNPDLQFVLIGDTGQHDAEIYAEIVAANPGRIKQVILRKATSQNMPDRLLAQLSRIERNGVAVSAVRDYGTVINDLKKP